MFQYVPALAGWSIEELLLYTSVISFGEGLGGFFFGFRDMPERILNGEVDKYLVRPVNVMIALLFDICILLIAADACKRCHYGRDYYKI